RVTIASVERRLAARPGVGEPIKSLGAWSILALASSDADFRAHVASRFGDPRVQALFGALCHFSHLPTGFRNRDLRPLVAALLGRELASYTAGAMTYDLRRLRLHGVIRRARGRCVIPSPRVAYGPRSCTPRFTAVC